MSAKMIRLLERGSLLGLCVYDEHTYKWMLALLLSVQYTETPDPHFIFAKLGELKKAKEAETKPYPHTWLRRYPEFPSELDSTMFAYAYQEDDRPVSVKLPRLKAIAARIPLRSNSRLLKVKGKPKHRRALRRESTESTEACAEPKEVVAEPLPAQSRSSAGTIDVEEQALLAK